MINHFLLTRFNLQVKSVKLWTRDRKNQEVQNQAWLEDRFELFETFCLPSVINQTSKAFEWLVYFDVDTPSFYKKKISYWNEEYPFFTPLFKPSYDDFMNEMSEDILSRCNECEYVITSRFDNDDSLGKEAIQAIQNDYQEIDGLIINLAKGYCLNIGEREFSTSLVVHDGPFVSMVESTCGPKLRTVYHRKHSNYLGNENLIQIEDEEHWIQLIHGRNLHNTIKGDLKRIVRFKSDFGIDKYKISYSLRRELVYFIYNMIRKLIPKTLQKKIAISIENIRK